MSQNNSNDKAAMFAKIEGINEVEGFDPTPFAVDYTDLETGEVRKRLPVMIQMAWFRMKYPEGRIAITVSPGKDCFVATAKVYPSYKDGAECYLAEATASRGYLADKPSVSPVNGHRRQPSALHCVTPASVCSLLWQVMSLKILPRMS